jgi:hypothetical protein
MDLIIESLIIYDRASDYLQTEENLQQLDVVQLYSLRKKF